MVNDDQNDGRFLSISLGSGYRAHPLDKSANDKFYSIRDKHVFARLSQSDYDAYPVIYDSDLVDVSGKINVVLDEDARGWKFTLPSSEKILAESRTFDDTVYFVSFEPDVASADPCQAGLSINRLYRVAITNGDPVSLDDEALDENDEEAIDEARVTKLQQGGIAVRPIFLFPSPVNPDCEGADCAPPPVGCVGVECFDPGFPNNPIRTLWTQNGVE
jgi:type IV pilus assembly protein PilY1